MIGKASSPIKKSRFLGIPDQGRKADTAAHVQAGRQSFAGPPTRDNQESGAEGLQTV